MKGLLSRQTSWGEESQSPESPTEKFEGCLLKDRDHEREQEQDRADEQESRPFRLTREALRRSHEKRQEVTSQGQRYSGHRCELERRDPRGDASMGKAPHSERRVGHSADRCNRLPRGRPCGG